MITKRQIRFAALISIALHLLFAFGITSILAYKRSMPPINDDFEKAININTYFPLKISQLAKNKNFKYIQIGTDCVFSGVVGDYLEDASQDANDIYGKTKIGGETEHADKCILRGSIVGPESGDGKSLLKL